MAAGTGKPMAVLMLLDASCNVEARSNVGMTPLLSPVEEGMPKSVKYCWMLGMEMQTLGC